MRNIHKGLLALLCAIGIVGCPATIKDMHLLQPEEKSSAILDNFYVYEDVKNDHTNYFAVSKTNYNPLAASELLKIGIKEEDLRKAYMLKYSKLADKLK